MTLRRRRIVVQTLVGVLLLLAVAALVALAVGVGTDDQSVPTVSLNPDDGLPTVSEAKPLVIEVEDRLEAVVSHNVARTEHLVARTQLVVVSKFGTVLPQATIVVEAGEALVERGEWPSVCTLTVLGPTASIAVSAPGWGTTRQDLSVETIRALGGDELKVLLAPQDVEWGRVRDASGRPYGGELLYLVFANGDSPWSVATDLGGWFPYPANAGDVILARATGIDVFAYPRRVASRIASIAVTQQSPLSLVIVERRGLQLRIEPGEVAGRATYDVQIRDSKRRVTMTSAFQSQGGVFLELDTDGVFECRVGTDGWLSDWYGVSVVAASSSPVELTVVLRPIAMISGIVHDPQGRPAPGAWVVIDHWPGGLSAAEWYLLDILYDRTRAVAPPPGGFGIEQTDNEGRFELPFRLGTVVAHHPAYTAVYSNPESIPDAPIALREGTVLEGKVNEPEVLAGLEDPAFILIKGPGKIEPYGPVHRQRDVISADGTFRLTAVRPGRSEVSVLTAQNEPLARLTLNIERDVVNYIDIPISMPNAVKLTIPQGNESLLGVELRSVKMSEKRMPCVGRSDTWSASVDWSGNTAVFVRMRGRSAVSAATIDIVPGHTDYLVELPGRTVRIVANLSGLAGAYALTVKRTNDTSNTLLASQLIDDGEWTEISNVDPGDYTVTVICQDGQPKPGVAVAVGEFTVTVDGPSLVVVELSGATRSVECAVSTSDGIFAGGVKLSATFSGRTVGQAVSDSEGNANLIVPADCVLTISGQASGTSGVRVAPVTVDAGVSSVQLVAAPTTAVEMQLLQADGSPYPGPDVDLEYLDGEDYGFGGTRKVASDGTTGMVPLLPGRWAARAAEGQVRQFHVERGETQTVLVQYPP